mgnify:CR=1 FL=1
MAKDSDILKGGKILPIMEEFYTLQGEGYNMGRAAYFVRLGGCDVGCSWCDIKESWNEDLFPPKDVASVILNIKANMELQQVRVYALNYNILRIMSGMGGLAYSN